MFKKLSLAGAALAMGATALIPATPAAAQSYGRHHYDRSYDRYDRGYDSRYGDPYRGGYEQRGYYDRRGYDGYKQRLSQTFTLSELAALYFGRNLISFLGGAPFAQDLDAAFAKIREALPARSLPYLARIQDLFSARPDPWKDYSNKQDIIAQLIDAVLHQRRATIAYFSFKSKRTKTYTVDPYRLVYWHGGLYLYARAEEHGEVRTFAVERIEKIEVRDETFEVPADFNVSEYARGAFGIAGGKPEAVEIAFEAAVAGYIRERVWHESQSLEEGPGHGVTLRMNVSPGFELKSWIKGFLPHVRVIKPAKLRAEIAKDLDQARKSFKS